MGLTTPTSRTYVRAGGGFTTRTFGHPVNYRDSAGRWRAIDSRLVGTGSGFRNAANRVRVDLPRRLEAGVRVRSGGASVSMDLQGADGAGSARGATARFRDALPGVSVAYTAEADGLKEALTLSDRRAPTVYRFRLRTSPGLRARKLRGGGIAIEDAQGRTRFSMPAAFMYAKREGAGRPRDVPMALRRAGDGWDLTLRPDRRWLASRLADGPVVIDPSVSIPAYPDCYVASDAPTSSFCSQETLEVGREGAGERRALVKFALAGIPADATLLHTRLGLFLESGAAVPARGIEVSVPPEPWTTSVTWNTSNGTSPWWVDLGDWHSGGSTNPSPAAVGDWAYWYPTALVERWIRKTSPNDGLILRDLGATGLRAFAAREYPDPEYADPEYAPFLDVDWMPRGGADGPGYKLAWQRLTDRMGVGVNVANGNLLVRSEDLRIRGTGERDFDFTRYYNSRLAAANARGATGGGWTAQPGLDSSLQVKADGTVEFFPGDGSGHAFKPSGSGGYDLPYGLAADLSARGGRYYDLAFRQTGERWTFDTGGSGGAAKLISIGDKYANAVQLAYNAAGRLSQVTDPQGRKTTFTHNPAGYLTDITDSTGRTWRYGYGTGGRASQLQTYTDPAGTTTGYGYDDSNRLASITTPAGRVTRITYRNDGRVASIVRTTDAAHTTGPTTKFDYWSGSPCSGNPVTFVSDPDAATAPGHTVTYCSGTATASVYKTVDSAGNAWTDVRGFDGNLAWQTHPGGGVTNYSYGPARNLTCVERGATAVENCSTASTGLKTTFEYANADALTRHFPTRVTSPQGNSVSVCYNGSTPVCGSPTGPPGSVRSVTNELRSENTQTFSYNGKGNLASHTDARGHTTRYGYDPGGDNLVSVEYPAGSGLGDERVAPDALGRPRVLTDGKGQTATYAYDPLDRVTGTAYAPGGPAFGYTHDPDGFVTATTDSGATTARAVDDLGRLTSAAGVSYAYDAASNLTAVTDGGGTTTYAYDGLNRPSAVTEPGDTARATFSYNAAGARTQIRYPSGVTVNWDYHGPSGRVTGVTNRGPSGNVLLQYDYDYVRPEDGRDTELPQVVTDDRGRTANAYDALDRLARAGPDRFDLDGNGNPTAGGRQYSTGNLLLRSDDGSYRYDLNGNLERGPHTTLAYNAANQTTFLRISTGSPDGEQLGYRGDGQGDLAREGWDLVRTSVLGLASRGNSYYARAVDGTLLSERTPRGRFNYLYDGYGSVAGLADGGGRLTSTYLYDAYGHPVADFGYYRLDNDNPFGWRGAYGVGAGDWGVFCGPLNAIAGRYYDPEAGSFTQVAFTLAQAVKATRRGFGVTDDANRVEGPWTVNDLKQGALGRAPRSHGRPDLHHGDQMPGSGIHEIPPGIHRGNTALHGNRFNQGVTDEMRLQDRQLHWWYRSQEMGGRDILGPKYYYDN